MAITSVSVVGPRAESNKQEAPKRDLFDEILRGVQIAHGVFGIASDVQKIRDHQGNIEINDQKLADTKQGTLSKDQEIEARKNFEQANEGDEGSFLLGYARNNGQLGPVYGKAKQQNRQVGTRVIKTPGPDGKPKEKIVEDVAGTEYEAYVAPDKPAKDITVAERNTLQSQYDRDPMVRKNRLVFSSYNEAKTYAAEGGPASDLSLIMAYYKANDPSSVVKETEAETAQALGGLENRAKAWYAKNSGDGGLTDPQRANLLRAIELKAQSAAKEQDGINNDFTVLSGRRGVDTQDLRMVSVPAFESRQNKGGGGSWGEAQAGTGKDSMAGAEVQIGNKKYKVADDGDTLIEIKPQGKW